jgi:glycosyltransferase involved in cell wall biosynthesis
MRTGPTTERSGPLRIAFCQPELEPLQDAARGQAIEAAQIQQARIAAGLDARGHHLTYLAPLGLSQVQCAEDLELPRIAPQTWSASPWFDAISRGAWQVQRLVGVPYLNVFSNYRRLDACLRCLPGHDVVYEYQALYKTGVAMACRRLGLPYVLFFDADQIAEHDFAGTPITGLLRWRARQMVRYNLRTARRVLCVSETARDGLVRDWHVPAEQVVVLPNGVDVELFRPSSEKRSAVRASLGLADQPVAIFVGNFYAWHDVATLLDAFARVVPSIPAARLLLVGSGPTLAAMQRRAVDLGIAAAASFLGRIPHRDVPGLVAASDVAVAPVPLMAGSSWLSPMKVFEYMAAGVATVASRSGQLARVLDDGRNGVLVPPGDAAALATALSTLFGDPTARRRLGAEARRDAVEHHAWEHHLTRLEQVFVDVLSGRSVRSA